MGRLQCPVQKSAVPLEKLNGVTNISVLLLRFTDTPLCKSLERGLGSRGLHISGDLWHQWNRSRKKMWSWDGRIREGMKWCRTNTEWRWCRETGHTRHKGLEIWHKETWWVLQWKRRQGICREPYPFSKALLHETAVEREKEREKERDKKCFLFQLRFSILHWTLLQIQNIFFLNPSFSFCWTFFLPLHCSFKIIISTHLKKNNPAISTFSTNLCCCFSTSVLYLHLFHVL